MILRTWFKIFPRISNSLNNSTNYNSTIQIPYQIIYGFRIRETLNLLRFNDPEFENNLAFRINAGIFWWKPSRIPTWYGEFRKSRRGFNLLSRRSNEYLPIILYKYQKCDCIRRNQNEKIFDWNHKPNFFNVGDFVNLRLHRGYQLPGIKYLKIRFQLIGPFKITKRNGKLTYRLELPKNMKIHDVISVTHFEPAINPTYDPYYRHRIPAFSIVVNDHKNSKIKKLLQKRRIKRNRNWSTQYFVK